MSMHKRSYGSYQGPLTPQWSRVAVLARYGFAEVWSSRITAILFTVCFIPALIWMFAIYLMNNPAARFLVGGNMRLLAIDEHFFLIALQMQCWLGLVLTAWIGPRLVAPDLADNALPIVLSRPISRVEYVVGKLAVLVGCLSAVTWVPLLLLFVFQCYSSPVPWAAKHLFIGFGLVAGALIWIVFLALYALALSAWVKWRVVATGAIFAGLLIPAGIGAIFNAVVRTNWGFLINVPRSMSTLWQWLLSVKPNGFEVREPLPIPAIVLMLLAVSGVCIAALNARIRAREVVRG